MRIIFLGALALAVGIGLTALSPSKASAGGCLIPALCGVQGPKVPGDIRDLPKHEQVLRHARKAQPVRRGNCVFRYFRPDRRPVAVPILFGTTGRAIGCPETRVVAEFCMNCAAFANGHQGMPPMFGITTAGAWSLERNMQGVWLPADMSLADLRWCEFAGNNTFEYRRFAGY